MLKLVELKRKEDHVPIFSKITTQQLKYKKACDVFLSYLW